MGYVLPRVGKVKFWVYPFLDFGVAELTLKRKLSLPVSRMWQWLVKASLFGTDIDARATEGRGRR